jgi:outer membrane lipopolysaccharide assembly protein LptE/RlpB
MIRKDASELAVAMTKQESTRLFVVLACLLLVGGCGYEHNGQYDKPPKSGYQWHSLYREDIQTVAVPIFQNRDFRRGVEFTLTKAVVNQLESHAPYKVVSRERADTVLEGEIVKVEVNTISRLFNEAVPQEQLMTVTVNFTWKDLRTGRILLERKNFQQTSTFYPTLREGTFVASQDAVEKLAVGIVQEMQADW